MSESLSLNAEQTLEPDRKVIAKESQAKISNHFVIAAVLLLTFMAFFSTLGYDFVYDDQGQIVQNGFIKSWSSAPQYFTKNVGAMCIQTRRAIIIALSFCSGF